MHGLLQVACNERLQHGSPLMLRHLCSFPSDNHDQPQYQPALPGMLVLMPKDVHYVP
jgi:hypothetical protein